MLNAFIFITLIIIEVVIATKYILKYLQQYKNNTPIKTIEIKLPKTYGQKMLEAQKAQEKYDEFMNRG